MKLKEGDKVIINGDKTLYGHILSKASPPKSIYEVNKNDPVCYIIQILDGTIALFYNKKVKLYEPEIRRINREEKIKSILEK